MARVQPTYPMERQYTSPQPHHQSSPRQHHTHLSPYAQHRRMPSYPSNGQSSSQHPAQRGASPRYAPYQSPRLGQAPQPRLLPAHQRSPLPSPPQSYAQQAAIHAQNLSQAKSRQDLSSGLGSKATESRSKQKAYETSRPTGLYQPSRGAQRDAKWQAKYAERAQMIQQVAAQDRAPSGYASSQGQFPAYSQGATPSRPPQVVENTLDRVRAEQQAAIAQARKAHAEAIQKKAKEEEERKVRRVQLQVFVHARPTACRWHGCEAVLNSWALLEKHLFHAHLSQLALDVPCLWDGCRDVHVDNRECYNHCLIGHMGIYSARCPFNCLFEGQTFDDLMAHIGRRHPKATPDDFVPGLIHHKPLYMPRKDELPKLPHLAVFSNDECGHPRLPWLCGEIRGYRDVRPKVERAVAKGCISNGRRPRKDDFIDKAGASAAITAIIENARRISAAYHATHPTEEEESDEDSEDPPHTAKSIPMTIDAAKEQGVDLVDIRRYAKVAKDCARKLAAYDTTMEADTDSESSTKAGVQRPILKVRLTGLQLKAGSREDEDSGSSSGDSAGTKFSLYRAGRKLSLSPSAQAGDNLAIKRSERLRRKAETGEESPV